MDSNVGGGCLRCVTVYCLRLPSKVLAIRFRSGLRGCDGSSFIIDRFLAVDAWVSRNVSRLDYHSDVNEIFHGILFYVSMAYCIYK